ncbi:PAS domain S-box protein [Breoghania sp.]|uniref:PAS domain S-box protein n=1 Tax=Breoghania sp. TaxID=2065378 RepID=UPI002AA8196D|nr:PAS domain S-box protein [Breoghania sp.]
MRGRFTGSVANRIIFWIILFSCAVSGCITAIQFYFEYQGHRREVEGSLADIQRSSLSGISRALWIQDQDQLQILMDGIEASGDIAYAAIIENGEMRVESGTRPGADGLVRKTPITFTHRGEEMEIGELEIVFDLGMARERMVLLALRILGTNLAITLALAIFIYFVFTRLVTRHVRAIADQMSAMGGGDLGKPIVLERARGRFGTREGEGDELDLLVSSFNGLRERLKVSKRNVEKGRDELKASERRYRAILDEMIDTYYRTDIDGVFTMITPSVRELLGWSAQDVIGKRAVEFYADTTGHGLFLESFREGGGAVRAFEAAMRHRDGHVVWVSTTARIYRDEEGGIAGIEGIARDITAQRQAADAIRSSRNQLRLVADSVPALITFADRDLKIRFANRTVGEWVGRNVDGLVGVQLETLMSPEWTERMRPYLDAVLAGETQMMTDVFPSPDGTPRRLDLRLVPHRAPDGRVEGFFALGIDSTERFMLEERLRQSQKMESVGQLTGGVAHDFNNLLGVILGNVEFLIEDEDMAPEERLKLLAAIQRAGERGARLTRQLLAFSRMQPLEPQALALGQDLTEFVSMLRPTIGDAVAVKVEAAPDLWLCMADRGLLELALLNLTLNARDAMPDGGEVKISISNADLTKESDAQLVGVEAGRYVMISVKDTGKGIAPEVQHQVFEPFFTTKDIGRGTGLGLSMVYGFVSQSGGQVALESAVGVGTTVRLYLPEARDVLQAPEVIAVEPGEAGAATHERVLVVEDDEDLRQLAATMLRRLGYQVMLAHDGPSALELLGNGVAPDIILTDVRLPEGLLGPDVVRTARERHAGIRAIYMTGFAEPGQLIEEELEEGDVLIKKPFRSEDIARALGRVSA